MKKIYFILISIFLLMSLSFYIPALSSYSNAAALDPNTYKPASDEDHQIDESAVSKYASRAAQFFYGLAVIVTVVSVMGVGIKYIVGSVSEKADYKKNLIPMFAGVMVIVLLGTILSIIAKYAGKI